MSCLLVLPFTPEGYLEIVVFSNPRFTLLPAFMDIPRGLLAGSYDSLCCRRYVLDQRLFLKLPEENGDALCRRAAQPPPPNTAVTALTAVLRSWAGWSQQDAFL